MKIERPLLAEWRRLRMVIDLLKADESKRGEGGWQAYVEGLAVRRRETRERLQEAEKALLASTELPDEKQVRTLHRVERWWAERPWIHEHHLEAARECVYLGLLRQDGPVVDLTPDGTNALEHAREDYWDVWDPKEEKRSDNSYPIQAVTPEEAAKIWIEKFDDQDEIGVLSGAREMRGHGPLSLSVSKVRTEEVVEIVISCVTRYVAIVGPRREKKTPKQRAEKKR